MRNGWSGDRGAIAVAPTDACGRRVATLFASATLVVASRHLLRAALASPRNAVFVLLSESCFPLYHPGVMWAQHMSEAHTSRVSQKSSPRWTPLMETDLFGLEHAKKSNQWFTLSRAHAAIVAEDSYVFDIVQAYCGADVRPRIECCRARSRALQPQPSVRRRTHDRFCRCRRLHGALLCLRCLHHLQISIHMTGALRLAILSFALSAFFVPPVSPIAASRRAGRRWTACTAAAVQAPCSTMQDIMTRLCVADEFYVPSVLAFYNASLSGVESSTWTDWSQGGWHPATLQPGSISAALEMVARIRDTDGCAPGRPTMHRVSEANRLELSGRQRLIRSALILAPPLAAAEHISVCAFRSCPEKCA